MAKKEIEVEFEIRDTVYLITDPEQNARMVIGINVRDGGLTYNVVHGTQDSWHYGFEMSGEKREKGAAGFLK